jgi:hypothetical protein
MTLHVEAVQGRSTWWVWTIRSTAGVLIEQSTMQFRSAEAAEVNGRERLAAFQDAGRRADAD